jgi:hypothetical protein
MKPVAIFVCLVAAATAEANPRALPFTYTTDTLPPGGVEIEQFADLVPLHGIDTNGNPVDYLGSDFQTEIEVGIADRLELGLYFTFAPSLAQDLSTASLARMPEGNGLKQRLRYLLADHGAWPIDVGVYGELAENQRELEFEGKILLERDFDRLRIAANLTAEYELYFAGQRELVLAPSLGATYEVTPAFRIGIDSWLSGEYPMHPKPPARTFGLGPEVYVGPAVMWAIGKLWWTTAVYGRVTDISHDVQPGERYGAVWIRSMVGYEL